MLKLLLLLFYYVSLVQLIAATTAVKFLQTAWGMLDCMWQHLYLHATVTYKQSLQAKYSEQRERRKLNL